MSAWECEGPKGVHRSIAELGSMGYAHYLGTMFVCHTTADYHEHRHCLTAMRKFTGTENEWQRQCTALIRQQELYDLSANS